MNRIDLSFAIAAVLLTKLQTCPLADIRFTSSEVVGIGAVLEERSGESVVNGFTPKQADKYLLWSHILLRDPCNDHEEQTFKVNMESPLFHGDPVPERAIINALDPPLNYGIKVLQASNIFAGICA